jgi:23S rRNA G2445 N2-methylase RlmL
LIAETHYFARVSAGLEPVAWDDITHRVGARLEGFGHRRIDFHSAGPPAALAELRAVDDVYVRVARLDGLDHTRASLGRLGRALGRVDVQPALEVVRSARAIPDPPTYRVTASHLGKRNYSRYDIEGAVADALDARLPWRFVLNAPGEPEPDLDLRVLLEDDWALLGLRLTATPLHRRAYKIASQPGSLKAPVAYCLGLLANLAPGNTLLDLACGAGTILAEAATLASGGLLLGVDVDPSALVLAETNLVALGVRARHIPAGALPQAMERRAGAGGHAAGNEALLVHADAAELSLPAAAVDAVIANLPWGQQVVVAADIAGLYVRIVRVAAGALKPAGRAVLLTDQTEPMRVALEGCPQLELLSSLQISLFGRHPTIYVLERAGFVLTQAL